MTRRCPRPDKVVFRSKAKAEQGRIAATAIARKVGFRRPTHSYECICGAWHLTSQPKPPKAPAPDLEAARGVMAETNFLELEEAAFDSVARRLADG